MAWYNFWKKPAVIPEMPVAEEPPKEVPFVASLPMTLTPKEIFKSNWRNGMWVMTKQGVGVIFKLGYFTEVHLVNSIGETIGVVLLEQQAMRQATFKEIPSSRKVGLTAEKAKELGYM